MDPQALAEREAQLYEAVAATMARISGADCSDDEIIAVFNSVHNWQMNKEIDRQQTARYQSRQPPAQQTDRQDDRQTDRQPPARSPKPKSNVNCVECGRTLTVGEKKYCDDADKQYRCYQCTKTRG